MNKNQGYKIAICILSLVIIFQWIFIAAIRKPQKLPNLIKVPRVIKGKIAIVIDDWGYNLNNLDLLRQIRYPLTVSVLPNLKYSQTVVQEARRLKFEIIMHLPMEPIEKIRLEQNTIMTSLSEKAIRKIVADDLDNIGYARGVSNHMGSKAAQDSRTMSIVFSELQKRGLYFLDSYVSADSVSLELAPKMRLAFVKRDVFLDNRQDAQYIRNQIYELKKKARAYGQAIGIGHDRRVTLKVLKDIMPELEKEGYKLVFVSSLL